MLRSIIQRRGIQYLQSLKSSRVTQSCKGESVCQSWIRPHTLSTRYSLLQSHSIHTSMLCRKQQPTPSISQQQEEKENMEAQVLNPKHQLLIGFTCKVCEIRSHHVMSKQAYTRGVVLIQCPDCKNRHLIADNLGWFKDTKTNVEDLVKEKGEAIRKVIVDEQGNRLPVEHLMEWVPEITAEEEKRIQEAKTRAEAMKDEKERK